MVCWVHSRADVLFSYDSVRIDAVHYCELEETLHETRKKQNKAFRSSRAVIDPGDIPNLRLQLLCRTVRESPNLADRVHFLKLPYMTRETSKPDLARTCSALPRLRYVDLPEGFFTGDPSCLPLRQELQARCPDIRKMSYFSGSEDEFEFLEQRQWQRIEVLDLSNLAIDPSTLRVVLASLPDLRKLSMSNMNWLDDSIFTQSPGLQDFPRLRTLSLERTPQITAKGLSTYLANSDNRETLASLTLNRTGVSIKELHKILWAASSLVHLAIIETVSRSLPLDQKLPPMTSISLKTMNYEVTSSEDAHGLQKPATSYYNYLAQSLHANALPALSTLYVRDQTFPEFLLLPPAPSIFSDGNSPDKPKTPAGFNQQMEIFSKGLDELEWVFTAITPPSATGNRRGSLTGGRPLSAYSASRGLGPQWAMGGFGGDARKSVMVGNGFGGFLAVPQDDEYRRPNTAGGGPTATRWGSVGSATSDSTTARSGNSRASWLKPPPSLANLGGSASEKWNKRVSRQDMWR